MSPDELKLIDSAIKIGFGGLIGILTAIVGGIVTYKTARISSKAKIHESSFELLSECVLHMNHYNANLAQYLYLIEHIHMLNNMDGDQTEEIDKQNTEIGRIGKVLFEESNTEISLAAAKLLFSGNKSAYKYVKEYDSIINKFYTAADYSMDSIDVFRVEIENQFVKVIDEISKQRGTLL